MSSKPGLKTKIEYAGLGEKVTDMLFKEKLSYEKICERLKIEDGIDLTIGSISNFKKFVLATVPDFLSQNKEYKEKMAQKLLDTIDMAVFIAETLKRKIEHFDSNPRHWKQQISYINAYIDELHLLMKKFGEIKAATFIEKQENVTNIQINMMVQMEIVRMIDTGQIPLEHCSDEIKQFYRKMKGNANFA